MKRIGAWALLCALTGCVQSHIMYRAAPMNNGGATISGSVGGFYGTDVDLDGGEEVAHKVGMLTLDLNADYGIARGVDAGVLFGTTGFGFRAKVGYAQPGGFAASVVPAVRIGIKSSSLDACGLVGFGPLTLFGFYGGQTEHYQDPSYTIYGGGGSYQAGPYIGGIEAQRWVEADTSIWIVQVGYFLGYTNED